VDPRRLVGAIREDRLASLTKDLVAIPSENPPGNEAAVAAYIARFFKRLGLESDLVEKVSGRPNVLVRHEGKGDGPTLFLTGHTDVVPAGAGWESDPYQPLIRDGKVFGRGACDMKGGLACILHVMELLVTHRVPLSGSLLCAFTVGEETGGAEGAAYLVERGLIAADMGILLEPSEFELVLAEEGVLWARLTTHGTTTHTLNAATATNAVEEMTSLLHSILAERSVLLKCDPGATESPILSVNIVAGGDKPNVIPGRCDASIDIRIPAGCGLSMEVVQGRLLDLLAKRRAADPALRVDATFDVVGRPFEQPRDAKIVQILADCAEEVLGYPPKIVGPVPSTDEDSDAYHYWTKGRIPTVYFGPGKISQAHAANEHVEVRELVQAAEILTRVVLRTCGEDRGGREP
jgi:acetylornithine deacetylase/succinyl-diaminopimelate desuccinylase family protein